MSTGHVSVFCQNLGITTFTLENYFHFKKEFLFNNGRILEINDYYNRSRGNVSFTEISEIIIYQIENLLGWINIDWGQVWERLRKCVPKWIKQKSKRNESCMSDFLSSPFSPVLTDLAAGTSTGESASLTLDKRDSLESKLLRALSE